MIPVEVAALAYAALTGVVIAFQLALAAGAPWGAYAMGGRFPGVFPPPMRMAALLQVGLLAAIAGVVLARAGLALPTWQGPAEWLIWGVVGFSVVGVVLNLITPSRIERLIWAPVAAALFVSALLVALG